jgi:nucleotide-binding universal stress UspA family protein
MASLLAAWAYRYNRREMLVMWSLSMPQVAATLAATLVGFRANLLTEDILNSVIVLMLVTSTLGPIITSRYAPELTVTPELDPEGVIGSLNWDEAEERFFTVVVPVHNPKTERYLIELAALLVRNYPGRIVPLSVATGHTHMNDPQITTALRRSQALLAAAVEVSREVGVEAEPLIRIDDSIAQGINRASREQNASLVVMGWGRRTGLQARLFGSVIDSVLWGSHCPVAISRLLESPTKVQRILVPLENMTPRSLWVTRFAHVLAEAIQAKVTLLHVSEPTVASPFSRSGEGKIAWTRAQLELMATKVSPNSMPQIQIQSDEDVVKAIAAVASEHDLVILCSSHRRTSAGGLAVSDVTSQITERLTCSIIMLGEPYAGTSSSLLGTNKAKTIQ